MGLLALAPGFAVYSAIYITPSPGPFRPLPPGPNSIGTIALVSFGALLAHTVAATVLALQYRWCVSHDCLVVPFEPNPYTWLSAGRLAANSYSIAALLGSLAGLSFMTWLIAFVAVWLLQLRGLLDFTLYGSFAGLVREAQPDSKYVGAFVLTRVDDSGRSLGYEGVVEDLHVSPGGGVASITLYACTPFYVVRHRQGIRRQPILRSRPIPRLRIEGARIENIAFDVFEITNEDA